MTETWIQISLVFNIKRDLVYCKQEISYLAEGV